MLTLSIMSPPGECEEIYSQGRLGLRFIDRLMNFMRGHKEAMEIWNVQRFVTRPSLGEVFRGPGIAETVERWLII